MLIRDRNYKYLTTQLAHNYTFNIPLVTPALTV